MAWVLEHPRDLAADFRAIYHITPAETQDLSAPEFFALAHRLPVYRGVMAARMEELELKERKHRKRRGVRQVEPTREAIQRDPLLAEAISFN